MELGAEDVIGVLISVVAEAQPGGKGTVTAAALK